MQLSLGQKTLVLELPCQLKQPFGRVELVAFTTLQIEQPHQGRIQLGKAWRGRTTLARINQWLKAPDAHLGCAREIVEQADLSDYPPLCFQVFGVVMSACRPFQQLQRLVILSHDFQCHAELGAYHGFAPSVTNCFG
jgi:hypothetical protein